MAEIGIYDQVVDELLKRQNLVKSELRGRFKGVKPFRQEPKSSREQLMEYDQLTPEKKQWLVSNFGEENVMPYFADMERLKARLTNNE